MILFVDTPDKLHKWLASAAPGATRCYFQGDLASARFTSHEADEIARCAYKLSELGLADLVQRKEDDRTDYIAIKRRKLRTQSIRA